MVRHCWVVLATINHGVKTMFGVNQQDRQTPNTRVFKKAVATSIAVSVIENKLCWSGPAVHKTHSNKYKFKSGELH